MSNQNKPTSRRVRPPAYNFVRAGQAAERFLKRQKQIVRELRHIRCKKESVFSDVAERSIA